MTRYLPRLRGFIAIAVTLIAALGSLHDYFPPLPSPLTLDVTLAEAAPDTSQPLVVTGRTGAGDFLFVKHLHDRAIVIGYESWGHPSQYSAPLPLPADRRLRLTVALPGLTQVRGIFAPPDARLRVKASDTVLFDEDVAHHIRLPDQIWFAENPIGGTACAPALDGEIRLADGALLHGSPTPLLSLATRTRAWLTISRWQAVFAVALGVFTWLAWPRVPWRTIGMLCAAAQRGPQAWAQDPTVRRLQSAWREHRAFAGTGGLATLLFTWMVTYGSFRLVAPEVFANFYDFQAASLLQGRLDVPREAISGEAFIHHGKVYGYFGLTPALLRLPFVIHDVAFGELTRVSMMVGFAAALLACHLLLRTAYGLAGRGTPSAFATALFVGTAGLGSTLFFLGSRAYVYHEAILWGIAFALFGAWAALRHYTAPRGRWWIGSLICGVLSVHARPPTGLFALTFLGVVALVLLVRERRTATAAWRHVLIGTACGLGIFSFNAVSYLKFRTFEGCPLRYNVQYDANRLARIDGKQFHLVNIPLAVECYLLRPNLRFEPGFPYLYIDGRVSALHHPEAKIDYHDKTLGFPFSMPALCWLALAGGLIAVRRAAGLRGPLLAAWGAGLPMALAMFAAIAITHRYTADFCPFLIVAAALGLAGADTLAGASRRVFAFVTFCAVLAGVLVTFALTLHYQGEEVWGVPDEIRAQYAALRQGVDQAVGALRR